MKRINIKDASNIWGRRPLAHKTIQSASRMTHKNMADLPSFAIQMDNKFILSRVDININDLLF